jgi:class 3 adenylate cyclase
MPDLPSGTVTFVFSDLEGSTRLLKQLGDAGYADMLRVHRQLVRETFDAHGGSEIDTQGDAFFYSFARARAAVAAAVELQRRHADHEWPNGERIRARLGLHTGEPIVGEEGYTGLDVVRAARIAADGRGGQILLSETTRSIVGDDVPDGVGIRELGERHLKDIDRPEPLYELVYEADTPERLPDQGRPSDAQVAPPVPPSPPPSMNFRLRDLLRGGGPGVDTGAMIEERVLQQLERTFKDVDFRSEVNKGKEKQAKRVVGPPTEIRELPAPTKRKSSVADEIARLRDLRDSGALTDEQYTRAVDRALSSD